MSEAGVEEMLTVMIIPATKMGTKNEEGMLERTCTVRCAGGRSNATAFPTVFIWMCLALDLDLSQIGRLPAISTEIETPCGIVFGLEVIGVSAAISLRSNI
jgi:hypothetical protein